MISDANACEYVSKSESSTLEIGRMLGGLLRVGDSVLLYGEMGAGKTCLARGIATGADCEVSARSPTFIILAEYPGRVRIFHCDLYRITGAAEAYELALDETIERGALVVEWPENADGALPPDSMVVRIVPGDNSDYRTISVTSTGPRSQALCGELAARLETD